MGTGKTTLVRGLCVDKNTQNVPAKSKQDTLGADTKRVTPYNCIHKRIDFTFIDTPGLKDVVNNTRDHRYLMEMPEPDVLLFTIKMTDRKVFDDDIDTIKNISYAFGYKVWRKAIFLLTFANNVKDPDDPDPQITRSDYSFYRRREDSLSEMVTDTLLKLSTVTDVAHNIPVIPAGLVRQPVIPSDKDKKSWVDEFWQEVICILNKPWQIITSRLNFGDDEEAGREQLAKQEEGSVMLNHFSILVTGKMNTGKTTLVRGLCGILGSNVDTKRVSVYNCVYKGTSLTFIDTPGLKDEVNNAHDHKYLMQMPEPDVLILTMKMNYIETHEDDIDTIKDISAAFGWKFWKKAMFLLTFANMVVNPEAKYEKSRYSFYRRREDSFSVKVTDTLLKLKAEPDVANNIPVIPVGLVREPIIPLDKDKRNWVEEFWKNVMDILTKTKYNSNPYYVDEEDVEEDLGWFEEENGHFEEDDEHWHEDL